MKFSGALTFLLLAAVPPLARSLPPLLDDPVPLPPAVPRVSPNVPVGKTLMIPITANANGERLTYKVQSSNPAIMVRAKTGNPVLRIAVSHADGGTADPAYTGTMEFMLFRDWLPITTGYVAGFAQAGFYNNVLFHRIADLGGGQGTTGFIFQGGDPLGSGGGGPGMTGNDPATSWKFQNEFHEGTIFSGRGQLAMANAGTQTGYSLGSGGTLIVPDYLDTNGSQFFITDGQPRHLDFKHNIFGQMLRGWEVLPLLKDTKTLSARPEKDLKITTASIVENESDAVLVLSARSLGTASITVTATNPAGESATRTFEVEAVKDTSNCGPFLRRNTTRNTPKDAPAVFALEAVDLEFDYMDIQHSMLPLSATLGPKGSLIAQSGRIVQMQPNPGYEGLINMGFSMRQYDIGGGGFQAISDYTNSYIAVGDREAHGEGAIVHAHPGVAFANTAAARLHDLDPSGAPGNFTAKINWGDGTPLSVGTMARDLGSGDPSLYVALGSHTYTQPGIYSVVVDFFGDRGTRATGHGTAIVTANALVASGEEFTVQSGRILNRIVATFTDASAGNPRDYEAWIDWGDGCISAGSIARDRETGEFLVRGTHGYKDSEPFAVRVRIHKKNTPATSDAIAWSTITTLFKAPPHLPPFPHGKLTIAWNSGPNKSATGNPGPDYRVKFTGTFVIINTGNRPLGASRIQFWLSDDRNLDKTGVQRDTPLRVNNQAALNIIPFPAGAGGSGDFTITLPAGASGGRKFLLAEAIYRDPLADSDGSDKFIATGPMPPTILISKTTGHTTTEGGGTATFTVMLDTPPINTAPQGQPPVEKVTIPIESNLLTEGTASPASLEFTAENWNIPQTVTITGVDDSVVDGNKTYKILLKAVQSADPLYNGLVGGEVSVTNSDNDTAQ